MRARLYLDLATHDGIHMLLVSQSWIHGGLGHSFSEGL